MDLRRRFSVSLLVIALLTLLPTGTTAQDVDGAKDHPLFNRLPDYYIDDYRENEFDYNMDLSRRRAEAVVEVLVSTHGVDLDRLEPHGVGPLVPASSNRSDDGRAENRRVELVER